jgi:hypothetical protein
MFGVNAQDNATWILLADFLKPREVGYGAGADDRALDAPGKRLIHVRLVAQAAT